MLNKLIEDFNNHDRRALAKIITYIESDQPNHQDLITQILTNIKKPSNNSIRIAVSGPPGVGKSSFIDKLGKIILDKNYKLAVLPIDPSSEITGGSILADKTRMTSIIKSPEVMIRPSPSRATLGGISITTKDVMYALESFGFNFIIIETVGVGQSEILAQALTDHFLVLTQPGIGDQLQAMKKGLLECADFILVNKTDGEQIILAEQTKKIFNNNHSYIQTISAHSGLNIQQVFEEIISRHEIIIKNQELTLKRQQGLKKILRFSFEHVLLRSIWANQDIQHMFDQVVTKLSNQEQPITPELNLLVNKITYGQHN